jgi:hypothetical protein
MMLNHFGRGKHELKRPSPTGAHHVHLALPANTRFISVINIVKDDFSLKVVVKLFDVTIFAFYHIFVVLIRISRCFAALLANVFGFS